MSITDTDEALSSLCGKYLTVVLGGEGYGIPVSRVREIIRLPKITPVPQMPASVSGVINLRGRVVPVLDLRLRFGLEAVLGERTCVVVVQFEKTATTAAVAMGLVVDAVEEVLNVSADMIEPTPEFGAAVAADCLLGMAKAGGGIKTLLAIDRVVFGPREPEATLVG